MIDISKILLTLEGIKLYSALIGDCVLTKVIDDENRDKRLIVSFKRNDETFYMPFDKYGRYIGRCRTYEKNGNYYLDNEIILTSDKCLLFPSKESLTWENYIPPLSILDAPIMCYVKKSKNVYQWELRHYGGTCGGKAFVFPQGGTSRQWKDSLYAVEMFDIMIPYKMFDYNNLEESMKYNIGYKKNNEE